jgi:eukaryotic-like serine/threonine-protein kinase
LARERGLAIQFAIASERGRLAEAKRISREWRELSARRGLRASGLNAVLDEAEMAIWFRADTAGTLRLLDAAALRYPLDSIPPAERPFARLVATYANAGRVAQAKTLLAAFERFAAASGTPFTQSSARLARSYVAFAERRPADAIRAVVAADFGPCAMCVLPVAAHAYDLAGNADSAVAIYERYLRRPGMYRVRTDALWLAGAYKRLGELYDARGDQARAAEYYAKFVDLWKDADPELQPKVREVRTRLAQLEEPHR